MKKILILALLCVGIYWCFKSCIGCDSSEESTSVSESTTVFQKAATESEKKFVELAEELTKSTKYYGDDYIAACEDLNFVEAHRILGELFSEGGMNWDYYKALEHIYKAEAIYLISEFGTKDASDKILLMLAQIPTVTKKYPEGNKTYEVHLDYQIWANSFNSICETIQKAAINRKNKYLAKQILQYYVDDMVIEGGFSSYDGSYYDHPTVKYTHTLRDNAKKRYKESVEMGFFDE